MLPLRIIVNPCNSSNRVQAEMPVSLLCKQSHITIPTKRRFSWASNLTIKTVYQQFQTIRATTIDSHLALPPIQASIINRFMLPRNQPQCNTPNLKISNKMRLYQAIALLFSRKHLPMAIAMRQFYRRPTLNLINFINSINKASRAQRLLFKTPKRIPSFLQLLVVGLKARLR